MQIHRLVFSQYIIKLDIHLAKEFILTNGVVVPDAHANAHGLLHGQFVSLLVGKPNGIQVLGDYITFEGLQKKDIKYGGSESRPEKRVSAVSPRDVLFLSKNHLPLSNQP
jgi:hypothetical protein